MEYAVIVKALSVVENVLTGRAAALFGQKLNSTSINYNRLVHSIDDGDTGEQAYVRDVSTCIAVAVTDVTQEGAEYKMVDILNRMAQLGIWEHGVFTHGTTEILGPRLQELARKGPFDSSEGVGYRAFAVVGLNGRYAERTIAHTPEESSCVAKVDEIRRKCGFGFTITMEGV